MNKLLYFFFLVLTNNCIAQSPTVGLTYYDGQVSEGYVLFSPEKNGDVFLIDPCGTVVNKWTFNENPGNESYLLDNGNLLYAGKDSLTIKDWDNNTIWSYATTDNGLKAHHDIEPLPNGNVLIIVSDFRNTTELVAAGRDPGTIGNNFKMDKIVELEPVGTSGANIVWEWYFWDHLIQDFDNTKANYGVVEDHPELLDLNFNHGNTQDWTHLNGIDYNEDLDQIIVSSRLMSELYIIDHSTTTAEAASHADGNANKGGDFLWRWGNPQVYKQGTASDQMLYGQHDPKWIPNGFPNAGMITTFNNGGDGTITHSLIHRIAPTMNGTYNYAFNTTFEPTTFDYSWGGDVLGEVVFSTIKAGVHTLSNGGHIICETVKGRFTELDAQDNVVWVYENPSDFSVYSQFDVISDNNNMSFRAEKYLPTHPGIVGNVLSDLGIIENANSLSATCASSMGLNSDEQMELEVINPIVNRTIEFSRPVDYIEATLWTSEGKLIQSWKNGSDQIFLPELNQGMYLISVQSTEGNFSFKVIIE